MRFLRIRIGKRLLFTPPSISLLFLLLASLAATAKASGSGLQVSFGSNGIQQLTYNGVVLENLAINPADAFHIWHMKTTDLQGNVLSGGQYDWGEVNNGRAFDPTTNTWTYNYIWGSIALQFAQSGDTLNMNVSVTNSSNSGVIFDGATIYPFVLSFPSLPVGFNDASYNQFAFNTTAPSVTLADFGQGEVAAVYANAALPLYTGFQPAGVTNSYTPLISGTAPDSLASYYPHNNRPVAPGQSDTYTVSLRFAASGTATSALAADAYQNWAQTWPPVLNWQDRRIIGTVYLASSAVGNPNYPAGYANNPRRYYNDSNPADFDVTTPAGLVSFQNRILQQAASNVQNLQQLNAQGVITWDIEGEQYPQDTSYVCEPDQIAQAAPEMETVISDPTSPYFGVKLDDAYFQIMRVAGFKLGVCVRPQHFTMNADGTASQVQLANAQVPAELIRKMQYAHDRWGVTLFYIDSTVDANGYALDPGILQQVAAAFPDSLLIPEESTPKGYAYTASFLSFLFHSDLSTPLDVYNYYPKAFSANLVNDVDPARLAQYTPQLTAAVQRGDILMVHADYWQANNPTVVQIYQNAGVITPTPPTPAPPVPTPPAPTPPAPPVPTPPAPPTPTPTPTPSVPAVSVTSPASGQTVSGTIIAIGQINVNLDAAGSYLMVDGAEVGTRRVTGSPFAYSLDTTTLSDGTYNLQIWAHDTNNDTLVSAAVSVIVNNGNASPTPPPTPAPAPVNTNFPISLTYPVSGQSLSGIVSATGVITQPLDAAGSYLMVDGLEVGTRRVTGAPYVYQLDTTTLTSGQHTLQIWAHDISNESLLSNPVTITVP